MIHSSFRSLLVWQRGMALSKAIYLLTKSFPKDELYGMTSQIRRAAVSVPANIAEGSQRSQKEFGNFLLIARGSLAELQTFLELARDLHFVAADQFSQLLQECEELSKMLHAFRQKVLENSETKI